MQDPQPSPLALLAATCSKIGHPGSAQQGQQQIKVIGPQGQVIQTTDLSQLAAAQGATAWVMDSSGKIIQQQIQQPVSSQAVPSTPTGSGAVTLAAGPGGQLVQQQVGVPQIIAGPGGTAQVAQQQLGTVQALNMLPQVQNITLPDGQEAIFIPANTAIPSQAVIQPQQTQQQMGIQQAVMLPNGQIVQAQNIVPAQQTQVAQQAQQAQQQQQQVQNVTLGGIPGIAQPQGSQIVNIGGVQYMATTVHPQAQNVLQALQLAPQIQQLQTIHIPVSTANGQTMYQAVQVPVQSLQPGAVQGGGAISVQQPGVITLGNQTVATGQMQQQQQPQQQQVKPVKVESAATSSQEQNQTELQSQQRQQQVQQVQIPTISVDSHGNITLNQTPVKGESQLQQQQQRQQSQQQQAAVLGAAGGLVSMSGGNVSIIQSPQTSTPQTPIVSVASLSQTMVTPTSTQSTPSTPATPGGVQQQVQNIILPNGQIVQGIQSPTVLNTANLQINSSGQIVQTPVINMTGKMFDT